MRSGLPEMMLAARYPTSGPDAGRIRVERVRRPRPEAGEVLVSVVVSGVNPTDWKARATIAQSAPPWVIPNQDGAGVIVDVGAGVPSSRIGERVWLWQAQWQRATGTAAEFVAIPAAQAVCLPESVGFDLGGGLGIPAMTAHRCLFADGPLSPRDYVLVQGGAGAVGHAAIELAVRAGAQVATTVSGPEKAVLARAASLIIDYQQEDVTQCVRGWAPNGVSRIVEVDLTRNLEHDVAVLSPHGVISVYARTTAPIQPPFALMAANAAIQFVLVYTMPEAAKHAAVAEITAALGDGALSELPVIRFPLQEAAAAHDAVQNGAVGKVLIDIGPQ